MINYFRSTLKANPAMIRETKKGRKGGNGGEGRKERERERRSAFLFISRTDSGGPDVVGHNVGVGH